MSISPIEDLIAEARAGRMVILVDDEGRENEGDLVISADCITPEAINFMATHGRGLICMPIIETLADRLNLPPMVTDNQSSHQTAFTVSIGARHGITTGISAHDRAATVRAAIAPDATAGDLIRPGHVFPLRARQGGVLARAGHTEAAVDLAVLAGYSPAGVICEVMKDDGTMARLPDLIEFGARHGIRIGTIADLIEWRKHNERKAA
jgi:3,4-dihydroxy 2-butanone 4-phosphate synthase/GTP cyclohydrolase II